MVMELEVKLKSDAKKIGEFIHKARLKKGIGKKKFGLLCDGLSETFIRKLENGQANVTLQSLIKLKQGTDYPVSIILTANEKTFSDKTIQLGRSEDYLLLKKNFAKRLKAIVKHRGLNSILFSNYLNMDESATNKYLQGTENPTYLMLLKFARVLDVTVVDLFDYGGQLPDNTNYKPRYL